MKIAITGASGHVGINVVHRLIADNHEVRALVYSNAKALENLEIERVKGGVNDPEALDKLCKGQEVVIHGAAKIGVGKHLHKGVWEVNVEGTQKVIEACIKAGVRRLIHFSSVHAYNQHPLDQTLDTSRDLITDNGILYDQSKAESQRLAMAANSPDLEVIVVNPSGVIGPLDYGSSLMGGVLKMLFSGSLPVLTSGGFDFVDVRDVADSVVNALSQGTPGEAYILGNRYYSIVEISKTVGKVLNISTPTLALPIWLSYVGLPFVWAWSKVTGKPQLYNMEYLDILKGGNPQIVNQKAKEELGLNPRSLEETILDTWHWYIENGDLPSKK